MTTWYDASVIRIEQETPSTRRYWLEVSDVADFIFKAGQFVTFDLPIGDKRLARWRSYSIASAPDGTNILEFCIVRSPDGAGTRYFFEEIAVGSSLRFKGPDGAFYLPDALEKDVVMICTGTGIAPFRSMLSDIFRQKKIHQNIHLIFGTRSKQDILYHSEMNFWKNNIPNFDFDIALSRENSTDFYDGYVHQIYLKKYTELRPDIVFYLCGWSRMIDETVENLILKLGYDRSQVKFELYG